MCTCNVNIKVNLVSQTVYVYVLSQTCQHLHQTYNVNIWAQLAMFSFESILYTFKSDLQFKHFSVLVFKHTNHVTYFSQYLPYSPKREYRSAVSKSLCTVCLLLTFNKSIQSMISLRIWFDKYCFIFLNLHGVLKIFCCGTILSRLEDGDMTFFLIFCTPVL